MTTATLTPARDSTARDSLVQHIPLHMLRGKDRFWADRLLSLFKGKTIDGVEWSIKFSFAGLAGNRFLLGIRREHWNELDVSALSRQLAIPQPLWMRILQDMEQARAIFFAYEPDEEGGDTYRVYLEIMPALEALRRHGVLPLGYGYKWHPATAGVAAVTAYRMRHLENREAFDGYLQPYLERLAQPVLRQVAENVIARATATGDPRHFMFLEVDEADTRRDSFTVTFHGAHLPLRDFIPSLLRLADSLALSRSEVLELFVPDEPRTLSSLAAGTSRDGHEFLTVYYD